MTNKKLNVGSGAKQRVTLKDISVASGVALSTVSNALSGKANVTPETRQKVLQIAAQFGYRISPVARSLRTGRTFSIGLLVSDITNTYYAEVMRGAEAALREAGYFLIVGNTDYDPTVEAQYIQHFMDQQVDGIILVMHSSMSDSVAQIQSTGTPLVLMNRRHALIVNDLVGTDFRAGTQLALRYLWDLGHRDVGFLTGKPGSSVTDDRLEGVEHFRRAIEPNTLNIHIGHADYSVDAGYDFTRDLLENFPGVTAIMTSQDQSAYGSLAALKTLGLSAPADISVLGFDDLPLSGSPLIDLTTLRVDRRALGEMAASSILGRINSGVAASKTEVVSPELVQRGTCGKPRPTSIMVTGYKHDDHSTRSNPASGDRGRFGHRA